MRIENEFAAKTEIGIVLEYFCEVRMHLRLRQKLELSYNISDELKLDFEIFCPGGERRGIRLGKFLSKKKKGEKEFDLEEFFQVKREKKSKARQVRRGVRSPVR